MTERGKYLNKGRPRELHVGEELASLFFYFLFLLLLLDGHTLIAGRGGRRREPFFVLCYLVYH